MSVKIQSDSGKKEAWIAEFNTLGAGDMQFLYNGKTVLKSEGIELGLLKEIHGIEKICRSHLSHKTGWSWVETETSHPFGSEPLIKRKWEQAANHIKVVSDIIIRAVTPMDHISIDSLKIPGKWNKVLIYSQLDTESTDIRIEEFDLSDFLGKEKKFNFTPLVLLFVAEDGTQLEIGAGFDLWRWHEAESRLNGKIEFALKGTDEGIVFDRNVFFSEEEYEVGRDNFRFSWYFAWGNVNDKASSIANNSCSCLVPSGKKLVSEKINKTLATSKEETELYNEVNHAYYLDNSKWPISAVVEGNENMFPCFCSRQTGNLLKSWLRSMYNQMKDQGSDIYLSEVDVHICSNSSHMIRGNRKKLIHWDYIYLLAFWEWANKYISESDAHFYITFSKDSSYLDLPSFKGLSGDF